MAGRHLPRMKGQRSPLVVVMVTSSSPYRRSAMAKHSGAHLDLSAFSSPEVPLLGDE